MATDKLQKPSATELEILHVLWAHGPCTVREVHEVLARGKAIGYTTAFSPPGPDGGVDIVAGRGPMGFDPPRLCVQVKSGSGPVNPEIIQRLHGSMKSVNAEQGLLISWGGFNSKVPTEERSQFFSIRLWDSGDLIQALLENYEKLSSDIKAELPLKRIWVLLE